LGELGNHRRQCGRVLAGADCVVGGDSVGRYANIRLAHQQTMETGPEMKRPIAKRPTSVRVQGKAFSIAYLKASQIPDDALGLTKYMDLSISVQEDVPLALEQEVIFHEITHAVEKSLDLDLTEHQVEVLSCGWVQVLRDNPSLLDYFKGK
jgi:hypothetical protein